MAPEQEEKLIEWLKRENEVLFRKMDGVEEAVRDLERLFLTHAPCAILQGHLKEHGDVRAKWWDVWSKVIVAAILGAGAALTAVWLEWKRL